MEFDRANLLQPLANTCSNFLTARFVKHPINSSNDASIEGNHTFPSSRNSFAKVVWQRGEDITRIYNSYTHTYIYIYECMNQTADTSKLCGCKFNRNVTRLAYVVEMSSNTVWPPVTRLFRNLSLFRLNEVHH